jgi:hypothetical protein
MFSKKEGVKEKDRLINELEDLQKRVTTQAKHIEELEEKHADDEEKVKDLYRLNWWNLMEDKTKKIFTGNLKIWAMNPSSRNELKSKYRTNFRKQQMKSNTWVMSWRSTSNRFEFFECLFVLKCSNCWIFKAEAEHRVVVQQNLQMLSLRANLDKQTTQNNLNNMKLTRLSGNRFSSCDHFQPTIFLFFSRLGQRHSAQRQTNKWFEHKEQHSKTKRRWKRKISAGKRENNQVKGNSHEKDDDDWCIEIRPWKRNFETEVGSRLDFFESCFEFDYFLQKHNIYIWKGKGNDEENDWTREKACRQSDTWKGFRWFSREVFLSFRDEFDFRSIKFDERVLYKNLFWRFFLP